MLALAERGIYKRMPAADMAVVLQVPIPELLRRNEAREKPGKETNEELLSRFERNREINPVSRKITFYNNTVAEDTAILEIKRLIFREICDKQRQ
jgi:ribose 1,5-bisphosphokinase PhnN